MRWAALSSIWANFFCQFACLTLLTFAPQDQRGSCSVAAFAVPSVFRPFALVAR